MSWFRRRGHAGDEYLAHISETTTNPALRAAAAEVQQEQSELIPINVHAIWTDCCGYVLNTDGVGAPLYILAQDEELAQVETTVHSSSGTAP